MQLGKLGDWLHMMASFGVLAGLIMVGLQIQQNTVWVRAEMASSFADAWMDIDSSKQDGAFAAVLAKSIEQPEDLTLAEMIQLDGYYFTYLDQLERERQLGGLEVSEDSIDRLIAATLPHFFGNAYAQAWWAESKFKLSDDLEEIVDREIAKISADHDQDYYARIRARLSE